MISAVQFCAGNNAALRQSLGNSDERADDDLHNGG